MLLFKTLEMGCLIMSEILWDLNVWFKEDWTPENGTTYSDVLTINPAVYARDGDGSIYDTVYKVYTGILYTCTPEETAKIRAIRTEIDYGTDWFDFADEFQALNISKSINDFIDALGDPTTVPVDDTDDLYDIDNIDKLSGLRILPTNDR